MRNPDLPIGIEETKAAFIALTAGEHGAAVLRRSITEVCAVALEANSGQIEPEATEAIEYALCGAEAGGAEGDWYLKLALMEACLALTPQKLDEQVKTCETEFGRSFEIWKAISPLKEERHDELQLSPGNDKLVEIEGLVVRAAQPWIDKGKLLPLMFAFAERAARVSGAEARNSKEEPGKLKGYYVGVAGTLERLLGDFGWDLVPDDEFDEPLSEFIDLALAYGNDEVRDLAWVSDAILDDAHARHQMILSGLRRFGA